MKLFRLFHGWQTVYDNALMLAYPSHARYNMHYARLRRRNKTFGRGKKGADNKGADNKGETKRAQNKKGPEQKGQRTKRARDHDVASPLHSRS